MGRKPSFSPPAKKASPRFTSPPPLSVSAPSTPRPVSPFQHVHSISSCPHQVSPQQEADISSVGTDQHNVKAVPIRLTNL